MAGAYKGGEHWAVNKWEGFGSVTTHAYPSGTHGNRFVLNYVNKIGAAAYAKYEDIGTAPTGTTVAKPSFTVSAKGQASIGPLFIMEKMVNDFNADTANWRYAMIMPGGVTAGVTNGPNSSAMGFCHECHQGAEDADYLFFLPEDVRAK
ncbi:MAG: cytochrome P460 family protein [Rhizobiaceae bacterium]